MWKKNKYVTTSTLVTCIFVIMVLVMIFLTYETPGLWWRKYMENAFSNIAFVRGVHWRGFPSQNGCNVELWCVFCAVRLNKLQLNWDAITPTWRHCNGSSGRLHGAIRVPSHKRYHTDRTIDMKSTINYWFASMMYFLDLMKWFAKLWKMLQFVISDSLNNEFS